MYHFLAEFLAAHPEYAAAPFYVFGESYGGHYAPNVAYAVLEGNKDPLNSALPKINLKGLAVGNGLTDPEIQYPYYPEMAYNNTYGVKAVNFVEYKLMNWAVPGCVKQIEACQNDTSACSGAQESCNLKLTTPYQLSGLNPYDVRLKCQVPGHC